MSLPIFTRLGVCLGLALVFTVGIHQSARADVLVAAWLHTKSLPQGKYPGAGYQSLQPDGGSLTPVMLPQTFTPVEVTEQQLAALEPDILSSSLILGPQAQSNMIPGCKMAYRANALVIMNRRLKCGEHVAVGNRKGQVLEMVNIGYIKNLGDKTFGPDSSVISMAAAKKFGFDPTIKAPNELGIVRLQPGQTIADLPQIQVTGKMPPVVLNPDLRKRVVVLNTTNIYHEARGEKAAGAWLSVWMSSGNRKRIGGYGNSMEQVILSGAYSWSLPGSGADRRMRERGLIPQIENSVVRYEQGHLNATELAMALKLGPDMTSYHSTVCRRGHEKECHPAWARKLRFIVQVGHQKFYGPYLPRMVASR